ncbi:polyamine aminopropyltransferase [Candidatus Sumerlaeota bacterium]|nr:polyamine aminopropyltransferase [Candidatus Sumerlaeota bacterium]
MIETANWIEETLFPDVETRYRITGTLTEKQTEFQQLRIVRSERFGGMLLLDGVVQTTERDEFIYHEMMAHIPLCAHPNPRHALIIGGGDGGVLREVLRHPSIERAVMVEIDPVVIETCREHLPSICDGAFEDQRTELIIGDGAKYVRETNERFDAVIIDSSDPIGPATVLFQQEFYQDVARILTQDGIVVRQAGATIMQPDEFPEAIRLLRGLYRHNGVYVYATPTYIGGFFCSTFSSMAVDPGAQDRSRIEANHARIDGALKYYNPDVHFSAFQLPEYMKARLR